MATLNKFQNNRQQVKEIPQISDDALHVFMEIGDWHLGKVYQGVIKDDPRFNKEQLVGSMKIISSKTCFNINQTQVERSFLLFCKFKVFINTVLCNCIVHSFLSKNILGIKRQTEGCLKSVGGSGLEKNAMPSWYLKINHFYYLNPLSVST